MKNLFLCFLLFLSFSAPFGLRASPAISQECDTPCGYCNCEEVESEDPLPATPIEGGLPLAILFGLGIGLIYKYA